MSTRPIIFNAEMVRAILDGRKTQMRRVVKPQPSSMLDLPTGRRWPLTPMVVYPDITYTTVCPFGARWDRLWVRETWQSAMSLDHFSPADIAKRSREAGYSPWAPIRYTADGAIENADVLSDFGGWGRVRPSIHMPRWASRITLVIADVRVERLKDISEDDALAEGAFFTDYGRKCMHGAKECAGAAHPQRRGWSMTKTVSHRECLSSPRHAFANFWNRIHGDGAWGANPWVWVVEFKQVTASGGE